MTEPEPPVSPATFETESRSNVYRGLNVQDRVFFSEDIHLASESTIAINGELLQYVGSGSWLKEFSNGRIYTSLCECNAINVMWQGSTADSALTIDTITINGTLFRFKG